MQKYRLYLSRLQKENDLKSSFGGMKHSDYPSKDPQGGIFGLQNSINIQQNDVTNCSYRFSGNNLVAQSVDSKSNEDDVKGVVPQPVAEPKRGSARSIPDSQKCRSSQVDSSHSYGETKKGLIGNASDSQKIRSSQMGVDHSFASVESELNFTAFGSTMPTKFSVTQMKQEHKPVIQLDNGFNKPQLPGPQHHLQADVLQSVTSISSRPSILDGETSRPIKNKPSQAVFRNNHVNHVSPPLSAADSFSEQTKSCVVDQDFDPIFTSTLNMKNQGFHLSNLPNFEAAQRNLFFGSGSSFPSLDDDLQFCFYPGDSFGMNLGEYSDPEVPTQLYEALRFGCENPCESSEYSLADQGLFA